MSDVWSLKDKIMDLKSINSVPLEPVIFSSDIMVLRQKLIEDLMALSHDIMNKDFELKKVGLPSTSGHEILMKVEKIINKRFGVKE